MVKDIHHVAQARTHRIQGLTRRRNCLSFNEVAMQADRTTDVSCPLGHSAKRGDVSMRTHRESATADPVPTHDLEEARVVGEAKLLRGSRDVPLVAFERRHDDLSLGFGLELDERARRGA